MSLDNVIRPTENVARLQVEWVVRQAMDFWRDSQSRYKSPLARERHRKKFLVYAKEAIRLAGVDAVAKVQNDNDWEKMIRELGREGEMAA